MSELASREAIVEDIRTAVRSLESSWRGSIDSSGRGWIDASGWLVAARVT
jgi:hypothetical protein